MHRDTAEPTVTEMPGRRAREWADHHGRTAAPSTYVYEFVWEVGEEAHGPFCTDVDGNVLLDFTSHVGAAPLGYRNPKVMEPLRELDLPDPAKIAGQDFYFSHGGPVEDPDLPGTTQLMDRLVESTGYGMDTVFLSNSGAEAVENALKICYDHTDGAGYAVTFEGAFHGRTLGALSLNRSKSVYRRRFPTVGGVHDVPYCRNVDCTPATCSCGFFPGGGAGGAGAGNGRAEGDGVHDGDGDGTASGNGAGDGHADGDRYTGGTGASKLRTKLDPDTGHVPPEDTAYVILEPVQGEGGYYAPSDAFLQEVADVCDRFDVPVIVDEIQSGMGRTGEMWAVDHGPIEPDVITAAKALRVGATISRSEVFPEETARLSSTWGAGDVLAALQGALTIDAIHDHDLLDNATRQGQAMREYVEDADPDCVVDVRGRGLMFAVEFDTQKRRNAVIEAALSRGLLTLGCGYKSIRLLPPLDVTDREVEMGMDLFLSAVEDAEVGAVEGEPGDVEAS